MKIKLSERDMLLIRRCIVQHYLVLQEEVENAISTTSQKRYSIHVDEINKLYKKFI